MNIILTSIIFFTVGNKLDKLSNNQDKKKKNNKELDQAEKKIKRLVGQDIDSPKVIGALSDFMKIGLKNNRELLIGNLFLTGIDLAKDMLMHKSDSSSLVHYNNNNYNGNTLIQRTNAFIGGEYSRKIKSFLSGPLHSKFEKNLFLSQEDALDSKSRADLKAECGINQRNTIFLDSRTFLTLDDLKELCGFDEKYNEIKKLRDRKESSKLGIKEEEERLMISLKKSIKRERNDRKKIDYKSALLKTKSKLKIINRLPVYDAHVIIHLASFKNNACDKMHTIEDLVNFIIPESTTMLERLSVTQLKKRTKSKILKFSQQLVTELNTRPIKLDSFKDNCQIIKSWERTIPASGHWYFSLTERHQDGVHLNKLFEFVERKVNSQMPSSFFLIIESYGSNKATVRRLKDDELISSVYSPCRLAFEYNLSISHLSKSEIDKTDEILSFVEIKKTDEFDEAGLSDAFYPNREVKFNIDMENIIILDNEKKPNAKFKLEMTDSLIDSNESNQMSEIKKVLFKNFGKEVSENYTRDDFKFEETHENNKNENQEDEDEFFGKN